MKKPDMKRLARMQALIAHDEAFAGFGVSLAGMDEAGRGPLLGPVTAACVIMPREPRLPWVDDSKKLSPARREEMFAAIRECALYIGVGEATAEEIDTVNILNATKLAMARAAASCPATLCLMETKSIIHGDAVSYSIAASSIIAKVTRDKEIAALAEAYPHYGLDRNMGYGTAEHIAAIQRFGACPAHRRSFIGKWIGQTGSDDR